MKASIRKIVRVIARWPYVGRLVRIGVAVIRLPQLLDQAHEQAAALHAITTTTTSPHFADLTQHVKPWDQFSVGQLPTLLQAISDLTYRQIAAESAHENLRVSVPVALRKITRDLTDLKALEPDVVSLKHDVVQLREQLILNASSTARLTEQMLGIVAEIEALKQQSAGIANLSRESHAMAESTSNSIAYAVQRIEFVRRELMFELRYGAGAKDSAKALDVTSEIISPDKLEDARKGQLRLNLGCGHIALDGYVNVDRRALPGVDIVSEVNALPLEAGVADEIFSSHLLEHFPEEQLRRELLPYYYELLKTGGSFRAVVPDAQAMISNYAEGNYPYEDMREVLYGAQDYDGDFHFNMFTPESLSALLREAGFATPKIIESGRKNGRCYEFEIVAEKQKSPTIQMTIS
jgi:predicted SAM-dependent methyltransferase